MDSLPPDSNVVALSPVEDSLSFAVTAVGSDPSDTPGIPTSGLVACDLYVSTDGGPFVYWTTVHPDAPTAIFAAQSGHTYAFQSIGHDALGNTEVKGDLIEASTFVPDLTPPTTRVTSVGAKTSNFQVTVQGSDTGGSGLAYSLVFVRVDGGAPRQIGVLDTPSGTIPYEAIADGKSHTYVFYSQGVDGAGNVQAPPSETGGAVTVTAKFKPPASLQPEGLMVQDDAGRRTVVGPHRGSDVQRECRPLLARPSRRYPPDPAQARRQKVPGPSEEDAARRGSRDRVRLRG